MMMIPKFHSISGVFIPPGDKSISHRAAFLAAISEGRSRLKNFLHSDDTDATLSALTGLGVEIMRKKDDIEIIEISGVGLKGLKKPQTILDLKNSGTSLRCLTGILSAQGFSSVLTGDTSLKRRPMGELVGLLNSMGARIRAEENSHAPIFIDPVFHWPVFHWPVFHGPVFQGLDAISYHLKSPSAQLKTALLLAGLYASGEMKIFERVPTRDHTERLFQKWGIPIQRGEGFIKMRGGGCGIKLEGTSFNIPGDLSAASFFIAAALLLPDSELEIKSVGLNPTRTGFIDIVRQMSASIEIEIVNDPLSNDEPFGNIYMKSSKLKGIFIPESLTIRSLDEIPLVALLATQAEGTTKIFGIEPLRFKESNRVAAICDGLGRMGANIADHSDHLRIDGPTPLGGAFLQSHDDHRIAMMLFVAAQVARGAVEMDDLSSISVSFPDFMSVFQRLCAN